MKEASVIKRRTRTSRGIRAALVAVALVLGGAFVATPRGDAWPGTQLSAAEMQSTTGGNGYKCTGYDDCLQSCFSDGGDGSIEFPATLYQVCAYNPPGECYNTEQFNCLRQHWSNWNCTGNLTEDYYPVTSCL